MAAGRAWRRCRFSPLALRPAVSGGLPLHLFSRGSPRRDISAPSALLHKAEDPVPDLPDTERFFGPLAAPAAPRAAGKTTSQFLSTMSVYHRPVTKPVTNPPFSFKICLSVLIKISSIFVHLLHFVLENMKTAVFRRFSTFYLLNSQRQVKQVPPGPTPSMR